MPRTLPRLAAPLLALLLAVPAASAASLTGVVTKVADGDTVTLKTEAGIERIRLVGIDTPEKAQKPWGPRAKEFTHSLAMGKTVRVETDVQPRDRYGRLLGYVYVGKTFLNLELVRQGYAMVYTYPPNVAHADAFVAAQREARAKGLNIWHPEDGLTQSPSDFRKEQRRNQRRDQYRDGER